MPGVPKNPDRGRARTMPAEHPPQRARGSRFAERSPGFCRRITMRLAAWADRAALGNPEESAFAHRQFRAIGAHPRKELRASHNAIWQIEPNLEIRKPWDDRDLRRCLFSRTNLMAVEAMKEGA